MDFRNSKPSKNFVDQTGDTKRSIRSQLLDPYAPWENLIPDWNANELGRIEKGEDVLNILRERMKNLFLRNFFMEGGDKSIRPFDFHKEDFDTHSSLRKKSRGSAYDNY